MVRCIYFEKRAIFYRLSILLYVNCCFALIIGDNATEQDVLDGDRPDMVTSDILTNEQAGDLGSSYQVDENSEASSGDASFAVLKDDIKVSENASNSSVPSIRWPCKPYSSFVNSSPSVEIINNETRLSNIISSLNNSEECSLVLFYSPYCEFCTNTAPLYNAIGRSYNNLLVVASDAQKVMGMSARYGIVGIPTILLFYSGKAVAKYNRSRTATDFVEFIFELTGLSPVAALNITEQDEAGPIATTLKESKDYYLIFSIAFLLVFLLGKIFGSILKRSFNICIASLKGIFNREKVD